MDKSISLRTERLVIAPFPLEELRHTVEKQESPDLRQAYQEMLGRSTDAAGIWRLAGMLTASSSARIILGHIEFEALAQEESGTGDG